MHVTDIDCYENGCNGIDDNDKAIADYINTYFNTKTYEGKAVTSHMNGDTETYTEYNLDFNEKVIHHDYYYHYHNYHHYYHYCRLSIVKKK